jgi:hypothetical protein
MTERTGVVAMKVVAMTEGDGVVAMRVIEKMKRVIAGTVVAGAEGVVAMRVVAGAEGVVAGTKRVVALSASLFLFLLVIAGVTRNLCIHDRPTMR